METLVIERRRHARLPLARSSWRELRLRTGDRLVIVNIGAGGALVESERRLLPGTAVFVQLISLSETSQPRGLRAAVVRCYVWTLAGPQGLRYRAAFSFAEEVEVRPPR